MKRYVQLIMALISFISANAYADAVSLNDGLSWVTSISAGPGWATGGNNQTFFLEPEIEKTYVNKNSTRVFPTGALFLGIQTGLPSYFIGQVGLSVATAGNAKLQGTIWDDADPEFENLSYQYKIWHNEIALKGILLLDYSCELKPWISASIGVGFNLAHGYNNTPLIFEALPNNNFRNHLQTTYSYAFGIGVQKTLTTHYQIGIGYEFADWGKSHLGSAEGQVFNTGLKVNHIYANSIMLNFTNIM